EAAEEELSNAISGNIDSIIADKLDNSKEDKNALKEFREFLEHIVKEKTSNKKLVFIIDELDRCRPDFALEIIEKIKHLFSVPGLTFVLVMNRTQLEESVKCRYGAGIEAQTYLQKFINIWLRLPSKRGQEYNLSDRGQFLDYAIKQMGSVLLSNNENTKNTFLKLVDVNETSFREIERMLTHMSIIQNVDKNITTYSWVYQVAISVLCFAKVHCPQICENLVSRSIDYDGVNKNLRVDFDNKDHYLREVAYFVKGILGSEEEREELIANKLLPTDRWGSFDDDVLISINDTLNNFIAN
ncbi:MAG TPA: hypothetical protein DCS35_17925, partial [Vibrio sp.]|nr:hypothetical protein [Vibrio sp.]